MHIDIIAYRKLQFAEKYGFTVRDLMILEALAKADYTSSISWFERPDVLWEALMKRPQIATQSVNITAPRVIDLNPIAAVTNGRLRSLTSFNKHKELRLGQEKTPRIVLDFHPFYIPSENFLKGSVYWYDVIDNFLRHNRFSGRQIDAVKRKYDFVSARAGHITAVSKKALDPFGRGDVLTNKLPLRQALSTSVLEECDFDFGFIGFITDKFDVELVRRLSQRGKKIFIAGKAYDKRTLGALRSIDGVFYDGSFGISDVDRILRRFRFGLIPYRVEKLHDESPIKFFQYITSGIPVIMSSSFSEIENDYSDFIHYYDIEKIDLLERFCSFFAESYGQKRDLLRCQAMADERLFWNSSLRNSISFLSDHFSVLSNQASVGDR